MENFSCGIQIAYNDNQATVKLEEFTRSKKFNKDINQEIVIDLYSNVIIFLLTL